MTGFAPAGFPHSDIPGSELACSSPRLIAACHVLHRRPVPRHPPCALNRLTSTTPFRGPVAGLSSRRSVGSDGIFPRSLHWYHRSPGTSVEAPKMLPNPSKPWFSNSVASPHRTPREGFRRREALQDRYGPIGGQRVGPIGAQSGPNRGPMGPQRPSVPAFPRGVMCGGGPRGPGRRVNDRQMLTLAAPAARP